jgi:HAD superfamily hydrolase (TIGR01490 family)
VTNEQREKLERGLALFDFDGTLVPWDTQVLFADFVLKREPVRRLYLPLFLSFLPCAGILGDEGMKRVFLSYLWMTKREQLEAWVREFVEEKIPGDCFPELLERLEGHREAGHLTVMASASPEFYVVEVGRALGFDLAFGTPVETGERVGLFPDLRNHKGEEKVRRLSGLLGPPVDGCWPRSHGYTDSRADLPMMRCCRRGTVVSPSDGLAEEAERAGWEIVRPQLPWTGKIDKARQLLGLLLGKG